MSVHKHSLSMYYVPFARITTHMLLIMISAVKVPMGGTDNETA